MIRVIIYLVAVGILAFAAVWLADRPGDVVITWQNRRIEMSVMVLAVGIVMVAVLFAMLWTGVRAVMRAPDVLRLYLRTRRGVRGYIAVSRGLIAVGTGDARAARRFADEAQRIAPTEPLTLLLSAQASQLAGDRASAERTFQTMASRQDTRLLGLHGLFIEAQRRDDMRAARLYAEEAAKSAPAPAWAGQAVFDARCAGGDWNGAMAQLDRNMKAGLIDRAAYQRQRAVLLTTRAQAADVHDPASARALALEAVRLAPTLIPAAALAGRLLGELGDLRRAARIVEAAWKANPHPELADTYAHLRPGDSARERLARVETLAQMTPGHIEGALAVARAAVDAQEFAAARAALAPLLSAPTQRVAILMAELEEGESGDLGRAREWMSRAVHARRDPAWTADGLISERWMPVSPVSGRLDAFQWRDPLAAFGGGSGGALVEAEANKERLSERFEPRLERPAPAERKPEEVALVGEQRPGEQRPGDQRLGMRKPVATPPAVIPLVQVPDDPGPEPEPPRDAWRRLRAMFR